MNQFKKTHVSEYVIPAPNMPKEVSLFFMTGGDYPFFSLCIDGVEEAHYELSNGMVEHDIFMLDSSDFDPEEPPKEPTFKVVTNLGGRYEYIHVVGTDGEEVFCHEVERGVAV